ncbi:MAG: hypothetical protein K2Y37_12465, partial [Pirellulales bacterium]|nr:hypothetical protein [Pirellulales bacterium]
SRNRSLREEPFFMEYQLPTISQKVQDQTGLENIHWSQSATRVASVRLAFIPRLESRVGFGRTSARSASNT